MLKARYPEALSAMDTETRSAHAGVGAEAQPARRARRGCDTVGAGGQAELVVRVGVSVAADAAGTWTNA
jgi:hypothetical protein